jgi:hypothetical protein
VRVSKDEVESGRNIFRSCPQKRESRSLRQRQHPWVPACAGTNGINRTLAHSRHSAVKQPAFGLRPKGRRDKPTLRPPCCLSRRRRRLSSLCPLIREGDGAPRGATINSSLCKARAPFGVKGARPAALNRDVFPVPSRDLHAYRCRPPPARSGAAPAPPQGRL